jgi:hypothetical protein
VRIITTRSLCTALETHTTDTAIGGKGEIILLAALPPVWWMAGTRAHNHSLVPIASAQVAVLIFGRSVVLPRVVHAGTTTLRPGGKAHGAQRLSVALAILVDKETDTSVGVGVAIICRFVLSEDNLVSSRRERSSRNHKGQNVIYSADLAALLKLFIVDVVDVSACELQRTRLKDLDMLASVEFKIPALLPVLVVHTRIIRFTAGAGTGTGTGTA